MGCRKTEEWYMPFKEKSFSVSTETREVESGSPLKKKAPIVVNANSKEERSHRGEDHRKHDRLPSMNFTFELPGWEASCFDGTKYRNQFHRFLWWILIRDESSPPRQSAALPLNVLIGPFVQYLSATFVRNYSFCLTPECSTKIGAIRVCCRIHSKTWRVWKVYSCVGVSRADG